MAQSNWFQRWLDAHTPQPDYSGKGFKGTGYDEPEYTGEPAPEPGQPGLGDKFIDILINLIGGRSSGSLSEASTPEEQASIMQSMQQPYSDTSEEELNPRMIPGVTGGGQFAEKFTGEVTDPSLEALKKLYIQMMQRGQSGESPLR